MDSVMRLNTTELGLTDAQLAGTGANATDISFYESISQELKQLGRLEDPLTIENKGFNWAEAQSDQMGMFGDIEAYKSGALDTYITASQTGADIMIPWSATGDNTCDDCMAKVDEGPYKPDEFPEPVHYGDQCNDPMADPIIVFAEDLGEPI